MHFYLIYWATDCMYLKKRDIFSHSNENNWLLYANSSFASVECCSFLLISLWKCRDSIVVFLVVFNFKLYSTFRQFHQVIGRTNEVACKMTNNDVTLHNSIFLSIPIKFRWIYVFNLKVFWLFLHLKKKWRRCIHEAVEKKRVRIEGRGKACREKRQGMQINPRIMQNVCVHCIHLSA